MCLLGLAVLGLKAVGDGCAGRAMRRGRLERRDHRHLAAGTDSRGAMHADWLLAPFGCRGGVETDGPMPK